MILPILHIPNLYAGQKNTAEVYEELGENYLSLQKFEKAKTALKRSLFINSRSANANYLLGFLFSAMQNWNESVKFLEKADELYPNHPEILRCLGWSIYHQGNFKTGLAILERACILAPKDALTLCDLALCYLSERDIARSENLLKKARNFDPNNSKIIEILNLITDLKNKSEIINHKKINPKS